ARVRWAAVGPERCHASDRRVVRVEHVDVWIGGKVRCEGDAHQPAIPEVVDVRAQVREQGRRNGRQVAIHEAPTALLRNEDPPLTTGCPPSPRAQVPLCRLLSEPTSEQTRARILVALGYARGLITKVRGASMHSRSKLQEEFTSRTS